MRYAIITGPASNVAAYLPENYSVLVERKIDDKYQTLVGGQDSRGWTLDSYVIPRLASGLYFGNEVTAVEAGEFGKDELQAAIKADAAALFAAPAEPLDPSDLIKALAAIVLDQHNRTAIDPQALKQARAALGLELG